MTTALPTRKEEAEEKLKPFCLEQPKQELKISKTALLSLLVILILSIRLIPPVPVGNQWRDDFNDGDIDGWTLSTIHSDWRGWLNPTQNGGAVIDGEFQFSNGTAYYHYVQTNEFYNYTRLIHPSTIANNAIWEFDYYPGGTTSTITLIGEQSYLRTYTGSKFPNHRLAYRLSIHALPHTATDPQDFLDNFFTSPPIDFEISGKPFIGFVKHYQFGQRRMETIYESSEIFPDEWYHIKVIRKADLFSVYLDEELILTFDDPDPFDNYWNFEEESYQFCFGSHGQTRVDNIVVKENESNSNSNSAPGWDIPSLLLILHAIVGIRKKKR